MTDIAEQASVLALVSGLVDGAAWHHASHLIEEAGSAVRLVAGDWSGIEESVLARAKPLARAVSQADVDGYVALIETLKLEGTGLVTVLDDGYPTNLREIPNRPPFLFYRGELAAGDSRSVAVVGAREASPEGLERARSLASHLAGENVTVISGLARGIDTAAHTAALDAGGRTIAVMGTGIRRVYPAENEGLARRILESGGALFSQFWPDSPPTKTSFPMRNVVMSGMAIGTVVVQATETSGAKMQARLALEHGKHLFLVEELVAHEAWAQRYARRPGVTVVRSAEEVLSVIDAESSAGATQLSFL